jgi:hypothetical protein
MTDRRPKVPIDSAAGLFDTAKIEYKLDAGQLNLPLAVTRVEGQLVSYDQVPSDPRRDSSIGTLKIEYPHPEGRQGYARARLEISSTAPNAGSAPTPASSEKNDSTWSKVAHTMNPKRLWTAATERTAKVDEAWELDIPRARLDKAITSLNQAGYFDSKSKGIDGVAINAKVDGKQLNKSWQQVPDLNELMLEVRNQGRLVAYTRPAGDPATPNQPSSIAAYQHYAEQDREASLIANRAPVGQYAHAAEYGAAPPQSPPGVVPYFPSNPSPSAAPVAQQPSAPLRVGSRPPQTIPSMQPPKTYPATGFGSAPPAPAMQPNMAQQPQWQGTPY